MHIAGKVFVCLNGVAAIVLMLLAAPVAKDRTEQRRQLDQLRLERIPGLTKDISQLERDRLEIQRAAVLERDNVTHARIEGRNRADELDSEISLLTDRVADAKSKIAGLQFGLKKVESEIAARNVESEALNVEIADQNQRQQILNRENADLQKRLDNSRGTVADLRKSIALGAQKIATLEEQILRESPDKKLAGAVD